jgi:transposase-like protein
MTNDTCDYQTGNGTCQNPATEGDHCWIDSHGGDVDGHGRPSKLDDVWDDVMDAAERGLTLEGVARAAGIGISTLRDWRTKHDDFSAALSRARARAEAELIENADAEFVLERSYGYTKEQEVEVTGDGFDLTLGTDEKEQLAELFDRDPQE